MIQSKSAPAEGVGLAPNPLDPAARVAPITGGARGIGFAIARTLAARGLSVAVNDLRQVDREQGVSRLRPCGVRAISVHGDVSIAADANSMVQRAHAAFGRLDVLVK